MYYYLLVFNLIWRKECIDFELCSWESLPQPDDDDIKEGKNLNRLMRVSIELRSRRKKEREKIVRKDETRERRAFIEKLTKYFYRCTHVTIIFINTLSDNLKCRNVDWHAGMNFYTVANETGAGVVEESLPRY